MNKRYIAKKRFGQNFLKDEYVLEQIIQSMSPTVTRVVEIGPGLGDLTHKLMSKYEVEAFEIDRDLSLILENKFSSQIENKSFKLNNIDVMDGWDNHLVDYQYDLVANLPYYVATKIILKALMDNNCRSITVMIQKEVALKFEENISSSLSVIANLVSNVNILFDVGAESFDPPPKVTSAVINFDKFGDFYGDNGVFDSHEKLELFLSFLRVCFKAPRKTLIKNLSSKFEKKILEPIFDDLLLKYNIRPHQVTTSTYIKIFNTIK